MKLNRFEKIFIGVYSLRIGKKYIKFNKLVPFMTFFMLLAGIFQEDSFYNIPILFYIGMVGVIFGIFVFYYFSIFPSRRPQNEEEVAKYFTVLNEKKS